MGAERFCVGLVRGADGVAAEGDALVDEPLGGRHRGDDADFAATAGLADDGHVARVAAEIGDVVVHPLQGGDDVEHADVAGVEVFLPADRSEIAESERVEPVVDGAADHVAVAGEVLSAVAVLLDGVAAGIAAAVQPDEHGPLLAVQAGRPDVEAEAVFADEVVVPVVRETAVGFGPAVIGDHLRGGLAEHERRAHVVPALGRLGRHEAVLAGGAGTVGDAAELVDVVEDEAAHAAILRVGDGDVFADEQPLSVRVLGGLAGRARAGAQQGRCRQQEEKILFHMGLNVGFHTNLYNNSVYL